MLQSFSPSHLTTYRGHRVQCYYCNYYKSCHYAPNAAIPTVITGPNTTTAYTTSRVAAPAVILTEKQKKAAAKRNWIKGELPMYSELLMGMISSMVKILS